MGWTFIALQSGLNDGSGTTLDAAGSLNVAAGDALLVYVKHEGAALTAADLTFQKDTGSPANTFTFDSSDYHSHGNGDMHACMGYLLSASADAPATFRLTLSGARTWRRFLVCQFRPDSGETVTKDASNDATGTGTSPASGNITTTGTDEVVFAGCSTYSGGTTTTEEINAATSTEPTGSPIGGGTAALQVWYNLLTATFINGQATAAGLSSQDWTSAVIALKAEAAGDPVVLMGQASF